MYTASQTAQLNTRKKVPAHFASFHTSLLSPLRGGTYLCLLLRKLAHMQKRMQSSPRQTPTMIPVTEWMSRTSRRGRTGVLLQLLAGRRHKVFSVQRTITFIKTNG